MSLDPLPPLLEGTALIALGHPLSVSSLSVAGNALKWLVQGFSRAGDHPVLNVESYWPGSPNSS